MAKIFSILLLSSALAACATAYQSVGLTGGYSETQLGDNIFQVYFKGNGFTSREQATDFSLLRSAELTLENGFTHFIIVDSSQYSKQGVYTTPSTSYTTGSAQSYGSGAYGSATTTTYGGQTHLTSKPRATNTIVCFKGKPQIEGLVYDAKFVYKSVTEKYDIKEETKPDNPVSPTP